MAERIEQTNWGGGIDNLSRRERVKEGCVRDALNVTPTNGGTFTLRPGAELVVSGSRIRGVLSVGADVLYAEGDKLMRLDTRTGTTEQLGSIPPAGAFAGAVLNDELFISTEADCLRYKAGVLRGWGLGECRFDVQRGTGQLVKGMYQVVCVQINQHGEESPTVAPASIALLDGCSLEVTCDPLPGHSVRVYASTADGETLYLQGVVSGALSLQTLRDDTARFQGGGELSPIPCRMLAQVGGSLACASGGLLWLTAPMRPHVRSSLERFFQFAAPVGVLLKAGDGLFVSADKTYFLSGIEGPAPSQREVLPYPAITGTGVQLRDGRAAWMTPYGLAIGQADGSVSLVSSDRFAPSCGTAGTSAAIDLDGNQTVVTGMTGPREDAGMVARDYYEVEIVQ
ncbi:hypothetical protein SAMN05216206_2754 [Pseudomonas guineae]|uniref:Delta-60 repeat domain-containing protein n=1 Tax=Pseudomonas guineae TaxID=425504 RepID=A0A1I3K985_9PSED|nr:hypothetical protein [Pseudomonas guineae]SFI69017.1 hypothetical protein SAMN05216206_2754 [Pseudomonas guineae]